MMEYKDFFKQHKDCIIYGHEDMVNITVEDLYGAIKARIEDELQLMDRTAAPNFRKKGGD